jgi:ABC-type transporter Mla MlaB component
VIRIEESQSRHVRVIGSLRGTAFELLSDAVSGGPTVLDLSQVEQADEACVRLLAGLAPERCTITGCPTWLGLWLARLRREGPGTTVSAP